jgi:hypothetical protein
LLAAGSPELAAVVRRLQADHVAMDAAWSQARAVLQSLADGTAQTLDASQSARLDAFAGLHASHLQAEAQLAYPAARERLDTPALARMSQDMMQRRGIDADAPVKPRPAGRRSPE